MVCADGLLRNALQPLSVQEARRRFWSRVDKSGTNGCWLWLGCTCGSTSIYGTHGYQGKTYKAHRLAYELTHGPIPNGMLACHRCDNKLCVNPDHIFLGTQKDNISDMYRKGRNRNVSLRGEENHRSKYTTNQAVDVKTLRLNGTSMKQISELTGVSEPAVNSICQGRVWRHVGDPSWTYPLVPISP